MRQLLLNRALVRALVLCALACVLPSLAAAQASSPNTNAEASKPAPTAADNAGGLTNNLFGNETVERRLREQREEIDALRALVREQTRLVGELKERVERAEQLAATLTQTPARPAVVADASYTAALPSTVAPPAAAAAMTTTNAAQDAKLEERVARAEKATEAVARQLAGITFSGDVRLRYETIFGQQNTAASADAAVPGALGNALTPRHRLRLRARLAMRGSIGKEFEWGVRLATGSFADAISANQTLTDFYTHKPFGIDRAFLTWKPSAAPGLQIQGGKFETPWLRTELTWDNDLSPEGLNERYTHKFKKSKLRSIDFIAWQLPMLERNSAFVLNSNGTVNFDASRRGGRDLALYGGQVRALVEPSKRVALTFSAADLYFSGTQFITPVQFFGANVQFPAVVALPSGGTVTAQVTIPRELFVAGSANLGISTANTNATNLDGRLASGFNLVDLIARAELRHSKEWPVTLVFDYVRNTQAHPVVAGRVGGVDVVVPNDEDDGFWAEAQVGQTEHRGGKQFGYTFIRIEKDAVLTPFNFSNLGFQSDSRVHRFNAAYAVDPRVVIAFTGFVSRRLNGLLGPFATTPPGSLDRTLTRLQLDTIFRF